MTGLVNRIMLTTSDANCVRDEEFKKEKGCSKREIYSENMDCTE